MDEVNTWWKTVENVGYIKLKRIQKYKKKNLQFRKFSTCK